MTPEQLITAKRLWEEDVAKSDIADRLGISTKTLRLAARDGGWLRPKVVKHKGPRTKPNNIERRLAPKVKDPVIWEALPGTKPKPFCEVALEGECNWILGDIPDSMADAICCAAPTMGRRHRYCPAHRGKGHDPNAWGEPLTPASLERKFGRTA